MSKPRYPLIALLGIAVPEINGDGYIFAADLERVLESAPVVKSYPQAMEVNNWFGHDSSGYTHTARLLCVQPIVKDTAESLLRELATYEAKLTEKGFFCSDTISDLANRARKLLERGE